MPSTPLTPQRWARIRELFEQCLELPEPERDHLLAEVATQDAELVAHVVAMLSTPGETTSLKEVAADWAGTALEDSLPKPGDQVGDFEILDTVGRGGMGVVLRGRDTRLGRDAAIKFLSAGTHRDRAARSQLVSEARAASALDHPNIATVYQVGETDQGHLYIAMAYYEGESLEEALDRRRLTPREVLDVSVQLARGLAASHAAGIVHRDVKPSNVILTPQGVVKLLDFGIAQFLGAEAGPGPAAGTPSYMSPEQAMGSSDPRADVWALGVVVQEMLNGRRATAPGVAPVRALRRVGALPASNRVVIDELRAIAGVAQSPDPTARYEDAGTMLVELERVARRPPPAVFTRRVLSYGLLGAVAGGVTLLTLTDRTIEAPSEGMLVLPFESRGDSIGLALTQGIHEALITDLAALGQFRVIAPGSAARFAESGLSPSAFAAELRADVVATGSITRVEDRLDVSLRLLDPTSESIVWTKAYDVAAGELQAFRRQLVNELAVQLGVPPDQLVVPETPIDPDAYRAFLRARYHLGRRQADDFLRAERLLEEAIGLDSTFADAYGSLAATRNIMPAYVGVSADLPGVEELALRALELDPTQPDALAALGQLEAGRLEWTSANEAFQAAIASDPSNSDIHHWYGMTLTAQGRFEEAREIYRRALDRDPVSLILNAAAAFPEYHSRDYEAAEAQLRAALELDHDFSVARGILGTVYAEMGRLEEAREVLEGVDLRGTDDILLYGLAKHGATEEARSELALRLEEGTIGDGAAARIFAALGDPDAALSYLEDAARVQRRQAWFAAVDPAFAHLVDDPRFQALLR